MVPAGSALLLHLHKEGIKLVCFVPGEDPFADLAISNGPVGLVGDGAIKTLASGLDTGGGRHEHLDSAVFLLAKVHNLEIREVETFKKLNPLEETIDTFVVFVSFGVLELVATY